MGSTVEKKIARGMVWTVASRLSTRVISAISVIIVAKYLTPYDYGVVAKAVLLQSLLEIFFVFGLETFLIRHKKPSVDMYDTVWTLNLISRCTLALFMYLVSYEVSVFLEEPALNEIIPWYAASMLLTGLVNIGVVDFVREMNFKKEFVYNVVVSVIGFVVVLYFAWQLKTFWAFVYGSLALESVRVILSYIMSNRRPFLSLGSISEVLGFSKWVFVHSASSAIAARIDWLVFSKLSTADSLGLYRVSNEISGSAASEIAMPVARSLLPGLMKTNSSNHFESVFNTTLSLSVSLALPISVGISLISVELVSVIFDDKWRLLSSYISILSYVSVPSVVSALYISSAFASGRQKYVAATSTFRMVLYAFVFPIMFFVYGDIGVVYGVVMCSWLYMLLLLYLMQKTELLALKTFFYNILGSVASTFVMFVLLTSVVYEYTGVTGLLEKILFGGVAFILTLICVSFFSNRKDDPVGLLLNKYVFGKVGVGRNIKGG